jgi:uncharacterized oligopeptide transporter (OPT) family protein
MDQRPPNASGPTKPYREVTLAAIVFGILIGGVMNAAITYAGLKIGFTIVGSAIAAVLGFGVLRGLLRRGSILETNIGQTIASAVNTTNAGIIFTVPVLMMLAHREGKGNPVQFDNPDFWWITLACIGGALLGVVFIVPLRKQMLDLERLRFPSATAVAAILKSPGAGTAKSIVLVVGALIGAAIYLPAGLPGIRVEAEIERLDRHVELDRISEADAALARTIDGWISAGRIPPELVRRGMFLEAAIDARESDQPSEAVDALTAQIDALPAEIRAYPQQLAQAAFRVSTGEATIESLRSRHNGWPARPLPGYKDLGIRLGDERHADPPPGDPSPLSARVDRDRDGRPDLVVTHDKIDVGRMLRLPDDFQLIFAIAPFAIGAGYLTGRAGLVVLTGGLLAYMVLNPMAFRSGWMPETTLPFQAPDFGLFAFNRPLGIGLLLGGALMGVLAALPAMREAVKSLARSGRAGVSPGAGGRDEMRLSTLLIIGTAALGLLLVAMEFGGGGGAASTGGLLGDKLGLPGWAVRIAIAVIGAAWIWFAGIIIAQCTGMTDWSPISGMALLTVVLVMFLAGTADVVSAVMLGAALCVAIACASDMMGDLKTGYLVGGVPRRQQWVEIICCVIGPLITMSTLVLIAGVNMQTAGVPIGPGTETVAPQAQALETVITGVRGGEMPYALYGLGALLGVFLGLAAFPGLGVLVGLSVYLPVFYILTYGLGCLANMVVAKIKGRSWAEEWGVPFCAGLIVGEAVLALTINSIVLMRG